jgi:tetratricopeptide (TPR) repeat protein
MTRTAIAIAVAAALAVPAVAGADTDRAKQLFEQGRKALASGQLERACKRFAASHEAEPSVGALLNLGECRQRQGRLATAWRTFGEAARLARDADDRKRAAYAGSRAAKLEVRLSFIELEVSPETAALDELEITLDGEPFDPELFNRAVAVDPGEHEVVARASGHRELRVPVSIEGDRAREEIAVTLEPGADGGGDAGSPEKGVSPAPPSSPVDDRRSDAGGGPRRTIALAAFAVAAVGVAGGSALGLSARGRWSDARACEDEPPCLEPDAELADSARSRANLATGAFVVAGLAAGVGLWLYLTGDDGDERAVTVAPAIGRDLGGLAVTGRF